MFELSTVFLGHLQGEGNQELWGLHIAPRYFKGNHFKRVEW